VLRGKTPARGADTRYAWTIDALFFAIAMDDHRTVFTRRDIAPRRTVISQTTF
jgi:hypothetical protein